MLKYMKPISPYTVPKVLLLGNGINRAFDGQKWEHLLKEICKQPFTDAEWAVLRKMPYPLLAVAVTGDDLATAMKDKADSFVNMEIPKEEREIIKQVVGDSFDAILTTDYSYEIEHSLCDDFAVKKWRQSPYRHHTCDRKSKALTESLYQYIEVCYNGKEVSVWHMHGEAARPDTMVIGHSYYGNIIARMQKHITESLRAHRMAEKQHKEYYPRSWVDYFLYGDVYIVGQGLSVHELDLWWLISAKKRSGMGSIYYFEPNAGIAKQTLSDAYDVNIIKLPVYNDDYKQYYRDVAKYLKEET